MYKCYGQNIAPRQWMCVQPFVGAPVSVSENTPKRFRFIRRRISHSRINITLQRGRQHSDGGRPNQIQKERAQLFLDCHPYVSMFLLMDLVQ